ARVMIEMPRRERHVEIARLTHRLAIVEAFDDREKPSMALDHARERIKMARPAMAAEPDPARLRLARRFHCPIDIRGRSLRELGQHLAGRGLERIEMGLAADPFAVNEMAEALVVLREPSARLGIALRRRAIIHRIEI